MKKPIQRILKEVSLVTLIILSSCGGKENPNDIISQQVENLLKSMTLEEKVGQMAQVTLDVVAQGKDIFTSNEPLALDTTLARKAILEYHVGSFLNTTNNRARTAATWNKVIAGLQHIAMRESRLPIPIIYGIDAIHGVTYTDSATMFPQEIALAATFDPAIARAAASITAYETRASAIPWNFSPVLDLGGDPRFSRQFEGFGEDPYLCSVMGSEMICGYEGKSVGDPTSVAACAKHFLGYSVPYSGKDRTPAVIPSHMLREYHLLPFKSAIEAGVKTIMVNSGIINGVSVHASYELLTTLLRKELGFKGVVVTDWNDIENLYRRDRIVPSMGEAIALSINAGVDMSMIPYHYEEFCTELVNCVRQGKVKESRIDEAVRRILTLKYELNLFEKPVTYRADYPLFGSVEHAAVSYTAAAEAITLLKNSKDILPLAPGKRILVCGPNANSMRAMNGGWSYSWQGEKTDEFTARFNTFYEAIAQRYGEKSVRWVPGVSYNNEIEYYKEHYDRFNELLPAARAADVVVLCLGENSYTEKPGDLNDLSLSDMQLEVAREVARAGKPMILILNEGRPRIISKIEPLMSAVLQTYLPSNYGGDALADIMLGKINPSGKLPYTYPSSPNSLVNYYHKPSERQEKMEGAYNYEGSFAPQYEFGFGLSYTQFTYKELRIEQMDLSKNDNITLSVEVTNSGKVAGKEVVMLYSSDAVASLSPDVKRLRRFDKVYLQPGESKRVSFTLPVSELAFVGLDDKPIVEAGEFILSIGSLSASIDVK